jgi:hypothetical protein
MMSFEKSKVIRTEQDGSRIVHVMEVADASKFRIDRMGEIADALVDASHKHLVALAKALVEVHKEEELAKKMAKLTAAEHHQPSYRQQIIAAGERLQAARGSTLEEFASSLHGHDSRGLSRREFLEDLGGTYRDRSPKKSRDEMLFAESISY